MSGLRGIAKNLSAAFSAHLVNVLQQVALTPLFLKGYGTAGLGEWLTLSASVSYLGTLDFGIQTFVNQDLTVRYHQGDMKGFHVRQSTALRMLLGIVATAALLALFTLVLPIERWLRMDGSGSGPALSGNIVRGTILVLAMQVLAGIFFGFFSGQFMVLGRAHIGGYLNNIKTLAMILSALPCVLLHTSFLVIALAQLGALLLCLGGALILLFRQGRAIFPTLRYFDRASVPEIVKPSGYFAVIFLTNFMVYQMPVLVLQRGSGPVAVAIFSVTRTIFSMVRNVINAFTQAVGPEVTTLYGRQDWPRLSRLYDYSERLVFALIPIANIGTLFLCPLLLTIWLRKPQMFVPAIYVLCATVSIVLSAKEHKFLFQFSTNTHRELARFMMLTYIVLVAAWFVVVPRFGVEGLLFAWLAVEVVQVVYIMRLNAKFFSAHEKLSARYPIRMGLLSMAFMAATLYTLPRVSTLPLLEQAATAIGVGLLILGLDIPLFGLASVWGVLRTRLRSRFA